MPIDPLTDFDWASHWRGLVDEREREVPVDPAQDFWAPPIRSLHYDPEQAARDPLLQVVAPYLGPRKTAIDAGAGAGRHAVPLAERLDWVTAVEPSEAMRGRIPHRDNLTVIGSSWEDAEVAPADLVVCAHVLYFVPEPVPFLHKLEASALERVFVFMRDLPMLTPSESLYQALTGKARTRMPQLYDLWNLLRSLGIEADVDIVEYEIEQLYADLDEAAAECRHRLGAIWREEEGRAWLGANLTARGDGMLNYGGAMTAGIAHWRPRPR
jgi:hypothetical protein